MAVRWQYEIGHYFRERSAPRRLFRCVGYNGSLICLQELDAELQPALVEVSSGQIVTVRAQQHPVQGLETVLEPLTAEQVDTYRILYCKNGPTDNKPIEEPVYDELEQQWTRR